VSFVRYVNIFLYLVVAAGPASAIFAQAAPFTHPLELPAVESSLAARSPLYAVARAGTRLVAVGQRGHIVFSDDDGASWKQAGVPVSTDLVAVSFPTATHGWAVGHGGVVLHSSDGGTRWVKQLDGKQSAELAIRHFEALAAGDASAEALLAREKRLVADGGTQPLLSVHFEDERTGYVVGTFNRIFRTDDGGTTWVPWMAQVDNPDELHFNAVAGSGGHLYLAGEWGMVWARDDAGRFVARPTPYEGSLFGLVVNGPEVILAYGMRGSVFRSEDAGRSWEKISLGTTVGITGGVMTPGGEIVLVTQGGTIAHSGDTGKTFSFMDPAMPMSYYGAALLNPGNVALVGAGGARIESVGAAEQISNSQ
jgi:photosystem II stability/assembly factor-like uncharacterized protein